jgi:hypothetical protein
VAGGTRPQQRRDDLFRATLHLKAYKMALFAARDDISSETILTQPIWIRGKEYAPIRAKQQTLPADMSPAAFKRWLQEQLAAMPRVVFAQPPQLHVQRQRHQPQRQMALFA